MNTSKHSGRSSISSSLALISYPVIIAIVQLWHIVTDFLLTRKCSRSDRCAYAQRLSARPSNWRFTRPADNAPTTRASKACSAVLSFGLQQPVNCCLCKIAKGLLEDIANVSAAATRA